MNVGQLRRALAELPGDMPAVVEDSQMGWMQNTGLHVVPARIDGRISGNYVYARHRIGAESRHAVWSTLPPGPA